MCTNKCNITYKLRLCLTCTGKYCFKPGLVDFIEEFPQHFLNYFSKVHMNVVPRSTMNTNGETEN